MFVSGALLSRISCRQFLPDQFIKVEAVYCSGLVSCPLRMRLVKQKNTNPNQNDAPP
jgi:hypothetical protein